MEVQRELLLARIGRVKDGVCWVLVACQVIRGPGQPGVSVSCIRASVVRASLGQRLTKTDKL
eukprot:4444982-Alexandrium_andersonii.AAC.1